MVENENGNSSQSAVTQNNDDTADIEENDLSSPDSKTKTNSNTLVVYFSCTGNTAQIASYIGEITNGDLLEIEPLKPYTSEDLSYDDNSRSRLEQYDEDYDVKIKPVTVDLSVYDIIYIGYPIWYNKAPRVICTFLKENDLSSKTVIPFCTSNESTIDNSVEELIALQPNAKWQSGIRFDIAETLQGVEEILKRQS